MFRGLEIEAEREILANRDVVQERAQQWVSDSIRPLQQQIAQLVHNNWLIVIIS